MAKLMAGMKYAHTDVKVWLKLPPKRERELGIQEPSPSHVFILSFDEKVSGGESEICRF